MGNLSVLTYSRKGLTGEGHIRFRPSQEHARGQGWGVEAGEGYVPGHCM